MDRDRIAELLQPFLERPLSLIQLEQISTYIDLLLRWNARINLTAIRDPEQIVTRHFGESLFMARHLFPFGTTEIAALIASPSEIAGNSSPSADRSQLETRGSKLIHVVDLGSGAGFPALPIKIWAPHIHLTMIESNQKKAIFLREAARALTLTDVDVLADRAESVATRLPSKAGAAKPESNDTFQPAEVVTFRAVEKFNQILLTAKKFLAPNARLAVLITEPQQKQLQALIPTTWSIAHVPKSHECLLAISEQ